MSEASEHTRSTSWMAALFCGAGDQHAFRHLHGRAAAGGLGRAVAPGGTLRIRICQLSAIVGRGVPLSATLNL